MFLEVHDPTWQNITPEFRIYCYDEKNARTKKLDTTLHQMMHLLLLEEN
jgi:hypothetical protein